ncbi:MAG: MOSC N-terminal beta barrel domain-containing protein [Ferrimonas sp.]
MSIITELWVYPVKGLQGISLTEVQCDLTGLAYDRHWMVVDAQGRFVTQRQLPQMASVITELTSQSLYLHHPNQPQPLRVPLAQTGARTTQQVTVWGDSLIAEVEAEAGAWLTSALQSPRALTLVRFASAEHRRVSGRHLQPQEQANTHFADGYPVLICNQQSLTQLNQALMVKGEQPVAMSRFRGNVVLDECGGAMAELQPLSFLSCEGVQLATRKPCERCPVTRIDQRSGQRQHPQEPLPTLTALYQGEGKAIPLFGGNAIVVQGGRLRVGERLRLIPNS